MLFDFEKHRSTIAAREMAPCSLEQRQRDVYDSHRHRVFSVSYYMTGSELEAEEILQGAFIEAFGRADEPNHAIIDAALLEQLRERAVLREDDHLPAPSVEYLPPRNNILRTELEEAIRYLPSTERLVFLLMDVEGYSAGQVAELLGMSKAVVLRTAFASRLRLRAELAQIRESDEPLDNGELTAA